MFLYSKFLFAVQASLLLTFLLHWISLPLQENEGPQRDSHIYLYYVYWRLVQTALRDYQLILANTGRRSLDEPRLPTFFQHDDPVLLRLVSRERKDWSNHALRTFNSTWKSSCFHNVRPRVSGYRHSRPRGKKTARPKNDLDSEYMDHTCICSVFPFTARQARS